MTINELITLLTEMKDEHGEDAEVRLMTQQNWPFENRIAGVTSNVEMKDFDEEANSYCPKCDVEMEEYTITCPACGTKCEHEEGDEMEPIIYLVEGGQLKYGDKTAWQTCRDC